MRLGISLVLSTIAFFVANSYIRRWLDSVDAPKGPARSFSQFAFAVAIAYAVAFLVDWV